MMKELMDTADQLFAFLDISQPQLDYIRRKLHSAIQLGYVNSPAQVHSEIANWVDIIETPFIEKTFERLSAPIIGSDHNGKPRYPQSAVTKETPFDLLVRKHDT